MGTAYVDLREARAEGNIMMRYKVIVALVQVFFAALVLSGCQWTIFKYYNPAGKKSPILEYEGYRIRYHIGAADVFEELGTDSFRVYLEVQYPNKVKDTGDIGLVEALAIDSVCVRFSDSEERIYPDLEQYRPARSIGFRGQRMTGPTYTFERIAIPPAQQTIELSFRVGLVDRKSEKIVSSRAFSEILYRGEKREAY